MWDAGTGRAIVVFRGHTTDLESVAISRDACFLVAAGEDGTARIFRCELCAPTENLLALARARVSRGLTAAERAEYLHHDG